VPNAARSSNQDATHTVTIRTLARANETANTAMFFDINKFWVRCFFPFAQYSLFRAIFGKYAEQFTTTTPPTSEPAILEAATLRWRPGFRFTGVPNRVSRLGHFW
jgi:hypothetical protein